MLTDLVELRRQAEAKQVENLDFRRYASAHHFSTETFQRIASEVQKQIDCTRCANCCRNSYVSVSEQETSAIAEYLGMPIEEVVHRYTQPSRDEPSGRALRSGPDGCIFLDGSLCMIYEVRPKVCQDFPHVSPGDHCEASRLSSLTRWAATCPIVYNALEEYKHQAGYHPRHANLR